MTLHGTRSPIPYFGLSISEVQSINRAIDLRVYRHLVEIDGSLLVAATGRGMSLLMAVTLVTGIIGFKN